MIKNYTVRELKKIISESATEFNPIMGKNVERDNTETNEKTYKDSLQKMRHYNNIKSLQDVNHTVVQDGNKGMQDLQYDNLTPNADNSFKKRVKSQLKGYVDDKAEEIHHVDPYGNASFTEIEGMSEKAKQFKDLNNKSKEIGLTAREIDPKKFNDMSSSVFEMKKSFKIKFKNTQFITESQMLKKVPDDFKVDGRVFYMSDKNDTTYLVEWGDKPSVVNITQSLNEAAKVSKLFNYKIGDAPTTNKGRVYEDNKLIDMLNKARNIIK